MKKILFISNTTYPYGGAYSNRMRHLVYLLRDAGYEVDMMVAYNEAQGISDDKRITYVHEKTGTLYSNCSLCAKPYVEALKEYLKANKISLIVSSSMPFAAPKLHKIAKKYGIPYVIEQCEWFDKTTFRFENFNPRYRKHISAIEKFNLKLDGVIAISTLFEKYYSSHQVPTVRIPTIVDTQISKMFYPEESQQIRVAFAGSLGNGKEHLAHIIEAISRINEESVHIVMDIYGPDKQGVLDNVGKDQAWLEKVEGYLRIHGRVPQSKVGDYIGKADFSFIMRPLRRSSNAGFPTKLAESMEVGTPVISNDTGDIGMYIESGYNGFMVDDDPQKLYELFQKIIKLSKDELNEMRKAARATAEKSFDYRNYREEMRQFIDSVINKGANCE